MSSYVTLLGAEDVSSAARTISSAADTMRSAASSIDYSMLTFQRLVECFEQAARALIEAMEKK